jgi:Domain of unknown function (DU1801)
MNPEIELYHTNQCDTDKEICTFLAETILKYLPQAEYKIWHAHPVWFIDGNPIVGYSNQKAGIRLMFWSGADFEDDALNIVGGKFKDASIFYNQVTEINITQLQIWLEKSRIMQWDYKNIVKRKGKLIKLNIIL